MPKLVDNVSRTHRKYSAQAAAAAIAIQTSWVGLKASGLADSLPPGAGKWIAYLTILAAGLGIVGGMIDQGSVTEPKPPEEPPQ